MQLNHSLFSFQVYFCFSETLNFSSTKGRGIYFLFVSLSLAFYIDIVFLGVADGMISSMLVQILRAFAPILAGEIATGSSLSGVLLL